MTGGARSERIYIVAVLVAVGLGLQVAVGRGLVLGAGIQQTTLSWLMVFAIAAVAATGAIWAGRGPEGAPGVAIPTGRIPLLRIPMDVVVPTLLAAGFALFVQLFESGVLQGAIVVMAGFVFGGVLWAQSQARFAAGARFALAQTALNVIAHLTAFLLFSVVYGLKLRSVISA